MKSILSILFFLTIVNCTAQLDSIFNLNPSSSAKNKIYGLASYFIWEEDSSGFIIDSTFNSTLQLNQNIVLSKKKFQNKNYSSTQIRHIIFDFSEDNSSRNKKSKFTLHNKIESKKKCFFPIVKRDIDSVASVMFVLKNNKWKSETQRKVLYFNVNEDSHMKYSHSSDSINLLKFKVHQKSNGTLVIKRFFDKQGLLLSEQIFNYFGINITSQFASNSKKDVKHILIFANGYRGRKTNRDVSDNLLTEKDRFHYWLKLDNAFINTIKPDAYFYLDGNSPIKTSNHRGMLHFTNSYFRVKWLSKKDRNSKKYHLLNTKQNDAGFFKRFEEGKIAGKVYLSQKNHLEEFTSTKDTIDLIVHSMGYAYSLGFVEIVKDFVVFRNAYIIAPENAKAGACDWSIFKEVWQYGTNLDQENPDPVWKQDGIAAQSEVKNIKYATIGGRVFFPDSYLYKNFVDCHMLDHYRWIFLELNAGQNGFVH